jgi:hypothetical protein
MLRCGPWRLIRFTAMDHCAEYDCAQNINFPRYGSPRRIWYCAVGHSAKFGFALWAIAPNLVPRSGPRRKIWFGAVGHSAKFVFYALRATAPNCDMHCGPLRRIS